MRRRYTFAHLSKWEREFLEAVLMEEVEIQAWFAVTWCDLLGEETLVTLQ